MSIRAAIDEIRRASATPITPVGVPREVGGKLRVEPAAVELAELAHLPIDEMTLARLVGSEVGSLPPQYYYAVAEVGLNEARARGLSVTKLLTGGPNPGFYGEQSGRWAATSRPANRKHLVAAQLAMRGKAAGFVRGARKFYDPKVQDGGQQRGKPLQYDAIGIVRKWYREGWRWIGELHDPETGEWLIDPYRLFLMSKTGPATLVEAEREIADGQKRWAGKLPAPDAGGTREETEIPWAAVAVGLALAAFSV